MLKRTKRIPNRPSGNDLPFFKDYLDEVLFKLEVKHVVSMPCTPEAKPQPVPKDQIPTMKL